MIFRVLLGIWRYLPSVSCSPLTATYYITFSRVLAGARDQLVLSDWGHETSDICYVIDWWFFNVINLFHLQLYDTFSPSITSTPRCVNQGNAGGRLDRVRRRLFHTIDVVEAVCDTCCRITDTYPLECGFHLCNGRPVCRECRLEGGTIDSFFCPNCLEDVLVDC